MPTLTIRSVEPLKPGAQPRELPDSNLPGLYLVIQPSGAKSWAVRYRSNETPRKHTLGAVLCELSGIEPEGGLDSNPPINWADMPFEDVDGGTARDVSSTRAAS